MLTKTMLIIALILFVLFYVAFTPVRLIYRSAMTMV